MKNKVSTIALLSVTSFLLFVLGFYSFAWFSNAMKSGDVGFTTGTLAAFKVEIAKIIHPESDDGTPVVITEDDRKFYPCDHENLRIEYESVPETNANGYTVNLEKMTFGIIDNVALLKPDNVVYLKVEIPKKDGDTVNIKLNYNLDADGNFVDIYRTVTEDDVTYQEKLTNDYKVNDENGDTVGIIEAFQSLDSLNLENNCFLRYSLCVSNNSYKENELAGLTYLGIDGEAADEDSLNHYKFNGLPDSDGDGDADDSITVVNSELESAGDNYYIYVRIEPNLNMFVRSIEYISSVMPCYIYFKIQATFEIHDGGAE